MKVRPSIGFYRTVKTQVDPFSMAICFAASLLLHRTRFCSKKSSVGKVVNSVCSKKVPMLLRCDCRV